MQDPWAHLQQIARNLTAEYPDAVFIGGIAVSAHASRLGSQFQESSHDADLYLSIQGKAAMRDRYEVRRTPHLGKDSVLIEGEDIDLYVEHQHPLGVSYVTIYAASEDIAAIRVASLEHLLVLKLDAAKSRWGSSKGEKDVRDLARVVALLDHPRGGLLQPLYSAERVDTLNRVLERRDIPKILGLNSFEGSKLRTRLDENHKAILGGMNPPLLPPPPSSPPPDSPPHGRSR